MAGSTISENLGAAGDVIDTVAYAVEFITFTLFFYEEGFQNFLRVYWKALKNKNVPLIMGMSYNDFDYMMAWWCNFFNSFGFIAVYSADGYYANMYMNMMYREYGNLLMGKGYLYYEGYSFGVPWWHGMNTTQPGEGKEYSDESAQKWLRDRLGDM